MTNKKQEKKTATPMRTYYVIGQETPCEIRFTSIRRKDLATMSEIISRGGEILELNIGLNSRKTKLSDFTITTSDHELENVIWQFLRTRFSEGDYNRLKDFIQSSLFLEEGYKILIDCDKLYVIKEIESKSHKKIINRSEQLAEEHAEWFVNIILQMFRPVIKETAKTFFIHGYKHAKEEKHGKQKTKK